jgi:alpha-glucosidase
MQYLVQNTNEKTDGILQIHLYKGRNQSEFVYYEDDGNSYDYQNQKFHKRKLSYFPEKKQFMLEKAEGSYISKFDKIKIVFHNFDEISKQISVNQTNNEVKFELFEMMKPIMTFDIYGTLQQTHLRNADKTVTFKNDSNQIIIQW